MLSHFRRALIGAVVIFFTSLLAGQPTPIPQPKPNPNPNPNAGEGKKARGAPIFNNATPGGGESMIEELIRQMQAKNPTTEGDSVSMVTKAKSALCPICNQPLYKHSDPNWEGCVPLDDEGNPRRMQRILCVQALDPISGTAFTAALPGNLNDRGGRDRY